MSFIHKYKDRFRTFWFTHLWRKDESVHKRALSAAIGVSIGLSPFWGLQTIIVIILIGLFRLNKIITLGFSYISIPPLIPFVLMAQLTIGHLIIGGNSASIELKSAGWHTLIDAGWTLLLGGLILSVASGLASYFLCRKILSQQK
ncbi:MAG: DUF2062 domain-containing protein [Candidatus Competibacteraceae bacterium]|nr:DUF2062 domain-containing protein [Candidatus Competibacteraceae bacterium]